MCGGCVPDRPSEARPLVQLLYVVDEHRDVEEVVGVVAAPRQVHRARSVPARLERRDAEGVRVDNDRAAVRRQVGVEVIRGDGRVGRRHPRVDGDDERARRRLARRRAHPVAAESIARHLHHVALVSAVLVGHAVPRAAQPRLARELAVEAKDARDTVRQHRPQSVAIVAAVAAKAPCRSVAVVAAPDSLGVAAVRAVVAVVEPTVVGANRRREAREEHGCQAHQWQRQLIASQGVTWRTACNAADLPRHVTRCGTMGRRT